MLPGFECDRCGRVVFATVVESFVGSRCASKAGCEGTFYRAIDRDIPARLERIRDRARPFRAES